MNSENKNKAYSPSHEEHLSWEEGIMAAGKKEKKNFFKFLLTNTSN